MSTTTSPTPGLAFYDQVHDYADKVRAHLADLPAEQVDDLTDGLEADLAEALADAPGALRRRDSTGPDGGATTLLDLTAQFGPAAEYAAELRSAAGLDPMSDVPRPKIGVRGSFLVASSVLVSGWRSLWEPVTSSGGWKVAKDFAVSLRPVWWVLRGWAVYQAVALATQREASVLPASLGMFVVFVVAIVLSVQWGRGRWQGRRGVPVLIRLSSIFAVIALVPFMSVIASWGDADQTSWDSGWNEGYVAGLDDQSSTVSNGGGIGNVPEDGVWVEGMQVSNLFVYDANGEPLTNVQIFDDRGRQVRTISDENAHQAWTVPDVAGSWLFQPSIAKDSRERWNVYPLSAVTLEDTTLDESTGEQVPSEGNDPRQLPLPFLKAPTVVAPEAPAAPDVTDAPGAPAGPDATDAPAATDTAGTIVTTSSS